METAWKLLRVLPWVDIAAVLCFVGAWISYARFAHRRSSRKPSLLAAGNQVRREWMYQSTFREVRVIDGIAIQSLTSSPSFFASTTIIIIGGLLALLGASERAAEIATELPFAVRTSALLFDMKLLLLVAVFVYAFFRFTWALRQFNFAIMLVVASPDRDIYRDSPDPEAMRRDFAERAGGVVALAAESFNDGLRAYYFAFAAVLWFISPWMFLAGTGAVLVVLFRREFHSEALALMRS